MGEPRPARPAKPGRTGGALAATGFSEPENVLKSYSVIVKNNGRVLHSGSLESCQFFVEMLELKDQVEIK